MQVVLIAATQFFGEAARDESGGKWQAEDWYNDSGALSEFAGRQCYESWTRPNPETATNRGYIKNIIGQGHTSVLEHGTATFRISGVSRSLTHELVRHRHFSYSQVSQRYVQVKADEFVIPPLYRDDVLACEMVRIQWEQAVELYDTLVAGSLPKLIQAGVDPHSARKQAREAARCVLPNMTPTAIVMSGNHLAWRQMLEKRGSIHADAEIRELAWYLYEKLYDLEPELYQDFNLIGQENGTFTVEKQNG